jgi:ribosomal protein S27E
LDNNKRIRISLIIINIAIILLPITLYFWERSFLHFLYGNPYNFQQINWDFREKVIYGLGWFAGLFSFFNLIIFCYIADKNHEVRLKIEEQKKNEDLKKQITEQELQMEREREIQRKRKLELLSNYETAGRYEAAASICDEFQMWEKAGELRKMAKTTYLISTSFSLGKDGAISVTCPTCGSSQSVESKSNMVKCQHCGNNYIIPKKILDMM